MYKLLAFPYRMQTESYCFLIFVTGTLQYQQTEQHFVKQAVSSSLVVVQPGQHVALHNPQHSLFPATLYRF